MKEQKTEVQLELVKRVAQSNWSVEDLKAVDDLLTDLYVKGQEQTEKDKRLNTPSLLGYFASVKLINNSRTKAEIFSLGSETFESSK